MTSVATKQAQAQGELDDYHPIARTHDDGRTLVYGIFNAGAWTGSESIRGGITLPDKDFTAVAQALREVGEYCSLPDRVIRNAIANLEPEEL